MRFDAIVCDLMMPQITGMGLHGRLVREWPEQAARMVFVTGGAFSPETRRFLEEVPNARLEKPFDISSLRRILSEAVGAERGQSGAEGGICC